MNNNVFVCFDLRLRNLAQDREHPPPTMCELWISWLLPGNRRDGPGRFKPLYLTTRDVVKISKTPQKNLKIPKLPMRCQNCILSDNFFKTGAKIWNRVPNIFKRVPKPLIGWQIPQNGRHHYYRVTKVSGFHNLAPGLHSYRRGPAWSVNYSVNFLTDFKGRHT